MNRGDTVIVLMRTVHENLKMEDKLEKSGIPFRTVAKPRQLGTECGVVLRIDRKYVSDVIECARILNCTIEGIYYQEVKTWKVFE